MVEHDMTELKHISWVWWISHTLAHSRG